ncbi:MAG: FkbM family methyltransferase [Daejeonella sp.]
MLTKTINLTLQKILPSRLYFNLLKWKRGYEEPELKLVKHLCNENLISIDVGAANGLYLAHLYEVSAKCYAFEPRISALQNLQRMFSGVSTSIQFENVALSNVSGFTEMKILKSNSTLSTIESGNRIERFGAVEVANVHVKRMDDYDFGGAVGFIKIDVEGHEEAVLEGSIGLLERDKPSLLIEIEERHKPGAVASILSFLRERGYEGFFYLDDHLNSVELFDLKKYQDFGSKDIYIFNFIFVHQSKISTIDHLLKNTSSDIMVL